MAVTASIAVSSKERTVQENLEARLEPTEALVGFTQGRHNPGAFGEKVYDIGLTRSRFLLICKDDPLKVYSFYHPFLKKVYFVEGSLIQPRGLRLDLGGETLCLVTHGAWGQRAALMAQQYARLEPPAVSLKAGQVLRLVRDLLDLGLPLAARSILRERMDADPVIEIEPASAVLDRQISASLLALKIGTWILGVVLIILIGQQAAGFSQVGLCLFLILGAIVGLVRGKLVMRGLAMALSFLTVLINLVAGVMMSSVPEMILWLSFGAAIFLTLAHRPTRGKLAARSSSFCLVWPAPWLPPEALSPGFD